MPRVLLLLGLAIALYLMFRRTQSVPPHRRRAEYIKFGLAIAVVIVVVLTVTGRLNWLGAIAAGLLVVLRQLLPILIRLFPMLAGRRRAQDSSAGKSRQTQTSTVETALLRMQLDHDTGDLHGEVLKGSFTGWRLADLDRQQLEELLAYCRNEDQESARLLDSYLQQRFPGEAPFEQAESNTGRNAGMNRAEALAILGLAEGASREDIAAAHRTLIQKLHPDRGGNDYLAAKINQAKDVLLG